MNQPSLLGVVGQLAVPVTTLVISLAAVLIALLSYRLSRQTSQQERARAGREERVALQLRGVKTVNRRWDSDRTIGETAQEFRDLVTALEQSPAVNGARLALQLQALNDVLSPSLEYGDRKSESRRPAIAARAMFASWVEDPFDTRAFERIWKRTMTSGPDHELHQALNRGR